MPQDRKLIVKIVLDLVIILIVGIPILVINSVWKPKQRGFFCDDDSIRYPFHDSSIASKVLRAVGILLPVVVISITEFANEARSKRENREHAYVLLRRPVPQVVLSLYKRIGVYLFGLSMSELIIHITKYSIGRLRPYFLDVCKPDVNCTLVKDPHMYIEFFKCTGDNAFTIQEARLSFPSGHTSISAYAMVYTVIYLHFCMTCRVNRLLKPFLQFILLMMTWYTEISRIADYKHHWSDVLVGSLLGTIVALITAFFIADFVETKKANDEDISMQRIVISTPVPNYNTMNAADVKATE